MMPSKGMSPEKEKPESDFISYDAPPLDFSFKNIKCLQQLKSVQPRQGEKKKEEELKIKKTIQLEEKVQAQDKIQKKKNEVTKLIPQNNLNSVVANIVSASNMKNISIKAKQEMQKKKKKSIRVKLVCSALMLGYNRIRQLYDFHPVVSTLMEEYIHLQWIDLSHNYLTTLDYDFSHYPSLKTLYLHCNFFSDLHEFQKLVPLIEFKSFTIHGNPVTTIPNFRILVISVLTQLKKLDSVLVSKKERDNAIFIRSQTKKYPLPKTITKPPIQKLEEDQEEKE